MLTLVTLASLSGAPHGDVAAALTSFTEAVARGDATTAGKHLHPAYVEVVQLPDQELVLTAEAYLGGVDAGRIGGKPIDLTICAIDVHWRVATASTVRRTGDMVLVSAVTLVHRDDAWTITSASTWTGAAE